MRGIYSKEIGKVRLVRKQPSFHFLDRNAKDEVSASARVRHPQRENFTRTLSMHIQVCENKEWLSFGGCMIECWQSDPELPET